VIADLCGLVFLAFMVRLLRAETDQLFMLLLLSINRIISSVLSLNKRHWLFKAGLRSRIAPRPEKQLSYLFFKDHKYCATAKQHLADDPAANPGTNRTFQRL